MFLSLGWRLKSKRMLRQNSAGCKRQSYPPVQNHLRADLVIGTSINQNPFVSSPVAVFVKLQNFLRICPRFDKCNYETDEVNFDVSESGKNLKQCFWGGTEPQDGLMCSLNARRRWWLEW